MSDQNDLNGRRVHIWRGRDRREDTADLANAIAATVKLYSHNGGISHLDEATGKLTGLSLAAFRELLDQHICGERVVVNGDGIGRREFYPYPFAPKPRYQAPTMKNHTPDADSDRQPDDKVIEEIFRHELAWRLPKVEGSVK